MKIYNPIQCANQVKENYTIENTEMNSSYHALKTFRFEILSQDNQIEDGRKIFISLEGVDLRKSARKLFGI